MTRSQSFRWLAGLISLPLLALPALLAAAVQQARTAEDEAKTKHIEPPVEVVVGKESGTTLRAASDFANPKVQPGRVQWHPTFAAACEAARKSDKPILLFQMMGKLDEQFC